MYVRYVRIPVSFLCIYVCMYALNENAKNMDVSTHYPVAVIRDQLQNVERLAGRSHLQVELPVTYIHTYIHHTVTPYGIKKQIDR